jgi:hypothetical protein
MMKPGQRRSAVSDVLILQHFSYRQEHCLHFASLSPERHHRGDRSPSKTSSATASMAAGMQ